MLKGAAPKSIVAVQLPPTSSVNLHLLFDTQCGNDHDLLYCPAVFAI